ncbi:hypothetical protein AVEN_206923-1 [Araneus ventricosus]|uniref:Uncharacterized protein n=1 Tax=Araneus ventricosus TaxID=182803 RepID=A0A4Y2IZH5_ARAVE|nr:hypothetical protein AVEN_206923-1 [Araneus ventricosus]
MATPTVLRTRNMAKRMTCKPTKKGLKWEHVSTLFFHGLLRWTRWDIQYRRNNETCMTCTTPTKRVKAGGNMIRHCFHGLLMQTDGTFRVWAQKWTNYRQATCDRTDSKWPNIMRRRQTQFKIMNV